MTRWSLRGRLGKTRDAEREYRPDTTAPAAGRPATRTPTAELPLAVDPPAGQPAHVRPDRGQPAHPQAHGQPSHGQPNHGQPNHGQPNHGQPPPGHPSGWFGPGQGYPGPAPAPPAAVPPYPAEPAAPVAAVPRAEREEAVIRAGGAWPDICDQFGLHLLVLAEQLRASLDELESDEGDPERLRRLYQVDHAVTRMRRASRDLRTLAGRNEEELAGFTTSLLDVIRMATSAIESYTQVTVGRVTDLAVLGYAADDVGALMAALLDNATRYSPGQVTVSGHLLDDGGVMFRVEDTGIGIGADQVAAINAALAGPVPDVDERTGRHTGFPVVHRIARKHQIGVRLTSRPLPTTGTVAMVTLPPHLLCELPAEEAQRRPGPATGAPAQSARQGNPVTDLTSRGKPTRPQQPPPRAAQWEPPELPGRDLPGREPSLSGRASLPGELPRRESASLRGDEPRPKLAEQGQRSPEQRAAARRAFADELNAFSLGATGAMGTVGGASGGFEQEDQR